MIDNDNSFLFYGNCKEKNLKNLKKIKLFAVKNELINVTTQLHKKYGGY